MVHEAALQTIEFPFFVRSMKLKIRNILILVPIVTFNYKMRFHNEFGSLMPNNLNWCAMYSIGTYFNAFGKQLGSGSK